MRRTIGEDKVVSVRFNYSELERLQYVYDHRPSRCNWLSLTGYIKKLIDVEYERLQKDRAANSLPWDV